MTKIINVFIADSPPSAKTGQVRAVSGFAAMRNADGSAYGRAVVPDAAGMPASHERCPGGPGWEFTSCAGEGAAGRWDHEAAEDGGKCPGTHVPETRDNRENSTVNPTKKPDFSRKRALFAKST